MKGVNTKNQENAGLPILTMAKPLPASLVYKALLVIAVLTQIAASPNAVAFDQPWNGFMEDITGNSPPPPPPCPSGNCQCPGPNNKSSPVYTADGSLVWADIDIAFPGFTSIGLKRTYNSFDYRAGLFGRGWVSAQESNIARTYRAVSAESEDDSAVTAASFEPAPIWLAPYGRRYELTETTTECRTPEVLYFTFEKTDDGRYKQVFENSPRFSVYSTNGDLVEEYSDDTGTTTYYEYNQRSQLIKQFDSYGYTLNFTYNEQGFVSSVADQSGRLWKYSYDSFGRLTRMLDPDGNSKNYGYREIDNTGYIQHLLVSIDANPDDLVLRVDWDEIAISPSEGALMRVASYMEGDGYRHDYTYSSTAYNGNPAVQVIKETHQIGSNNIIERQVFIADSANYQILESQSTIRGVTETQTYGNRGNVTEEVDIRGNITRYEYDSIGRPVKIVELFGSDAARETTFSYLGESDRVLSINEYGLLETRYEYDDLFRVLARSEIDLTTTVERKITFSYHSDSLDAEGNVIIGQLSEKDGFFSDSSGKTLYNYNDRGLLVSIENPLNQTTVFAYNEAGQLVSETDPNGVSTVFQYDSQNRLIRSNSEGRVREFGFRSGGLLIKSTDEYGLVTNFEYTVGDLLAKITFPANDYIVITYDHQPLFTEVTYTHHLETGEVIAEQSDRKDLLKEIDLDNFSAAGAKRYQHLGYSNFNDLTERVQFGEFGLQKNVTTSYSYNALGLLKEIQSRGLRETVSYNSQDDISAVDNSVAGITEFVLNAFGETVELNSPDSGRKKTDFDASGNPISITDGAGRKINYEYDNLSRVVKEDSQGDVEDIEYVYDEGAFGLGRLTSVSDGSGSTGISYDMYGLPRKVSSVVGSTELALQYSYTPDEEIDEIVYPSGIKVSYLTDEFGRLSGVELQRDLSVESVISGVEWRGSMLAQFLNGNGVKSEIEYDSGGRLTGKKFSEISVGINNDLDEFGNVVNQSWFTNGNIESHDFRYNELGYLVYDGLSLAELEYDFNGNLLSKNYLDDGLDTTLDYHGLSNRIASIGGAAITMDDSGKTTNDSYRQYSYNAYGRLASVLNRNTGLLGQYSYNYLGYRVKKSTVDGNLRSETVFVYGQQGELIGEYDTSGNRIREYVYLRENGYPEPIAQVESDGTLTYLHVDHLATPRFASDESGKLVWQWKSDAYGSDSASEDVDGDGENLTVNLRFPGHYFDEESELHYNLYRFYDPSIGRYITSDPIGLDGGSNTYLYARANPLLYVDEDGRIIPAIIAGIRAAAAAAAAVARLARLICRRNPQLCRNVLKCVRKPKKCLKKACAIAVNLIKHPVCDRIGGSCKGITSCAEVRRRQAGNVSCLGIRVFEQKVCFSGRSDRGHRDQIQKIRNRISKCNNKLKGPNSCCG